MNKLIKTFLILSIIFGVLVLTSCFEKELSHTHNFNEGEIVKEPTCSTKGIKEYKCIICEETKKESIDEIGHNYKNGKCIVCGSEDVEVHVHTESKWNIIEEATCKKEGIRQKVCTICQELLQTEIIEKLSHNYHEGMCLLCNEKDPDYIYSIGLKFKLSDDGSYYILEGIGTCIESDIKIPSTYNNLPVTTINESAFHSCTTLTSIEIPNSITTIGIGAFFGCNNLIQVTFEEGSKLTSINKYIFKKCINLKTFKIPSGVLNIEEEAFYECKSLENVEIPSSVTTIGYSAFARCTNLTNIEIPNSVTNIGYSTFYWCINLETITVPFVGSQLNGTKDTYFSYIFGTNSSVTTNNDVPQSLKKVIITGGTSIDEYAFYNCGYIERIEIPKSIISIGKKAFEFCSKLQEIVFEKDSQLKSIDEEAFSYCNNLTNIEIPNSVTNIEQSVFKNCLNLTGVIFEKNSNLTNIKLNMFYNCRKIEKIEIPQGVISVDLSAFHNCSNLKSVLIPASVNNILGSGFSGCVNLEKIEVANDNQYYQTIDGNLYSKDGKTLIRYAIGKKEKTFEIPSGVTNIKNSVFSDCQNLLEIIIPASTTNIDILGFLNCKSVVNIEADENNPEFKSIDGNLYNKDGKVLIQYAIGKTNEKFTISNTVIALGYGAFAYCTNLKKVEIPNSVVIIGDFAFLGSSNLKIYCEADSMPNTWGHWNPDKLPIVWGYNIE